MKCKSRIYCNNLPDNVTMKKCQKVRDIRKDNMRLQILKIEEKNMK